jgi:acyl-CoA synthetase (AMP-forming)/AMP-acid ligase II
MTIEIERRAPGVRAAFPPRVALLLPNSVEFHVAYFAAVKALAAPALLNPLYPALQLATKAAAMAPLTVLGVLQALPRI